MTTAEAKKFVGVKVKITHKWRGDSIHIIKEVYRRNFITPTDAFHFSDIKKIEAIS